jgi:cell division protein FtsI/penicillin-binding protein 2
MLLILARLWHLSIIQYDQKLEEARKPQKKVVIEPAIRATVRDRFNLPLAINKIQYQAAIFYAQLRDIPSIAWEKDAEGNRVKKFKRKEYIRQLAELMANELHLDAERIEDLIHSKASYYAQVPFVIKDELTEKEYYRLRMLSKDWPGIFVRKVPKRHYPQGRVAADVIGYMGAINRQEYEKILHEMQALEQMIAQGEDVEEFPPGIETTEQARKKLKDLEERAYTIHDYVGKTGVEGVFEKQLRGFYGKKNYYSDSKGNFLRELPGSRPPISGQRLLLTISAELQEYAEQLLAQNEVVRVVRLSHLGAVKKTILAIKHPWMKGGSIVAMEPQTGEVLALASYPRFDPNDFIASGNTSSNQAKTARINRWFENESYVANMWNQQQPIERERFERGQFYDEKSWLSWEVYLDFILPQTSAVKKALTRLATIGNAHAIQTKVDALRELYPDKTLYSIFNVFYSSEPHIPHKLQAADKRESNHLTAKVIKQKLDVYLEQVFQNYDKVLVVDLCRLIVPHERFSEQLLAKVAHYPLSFYKESSDNFVTIMAQLKEKGRHLFHAHDFNQWRKSNEKEFLKLKRAEEKRTKSYAKPYLDYLDQQENRAFQSFWETYKWDFLWAYLTGQAKAISNLDNELSDDLEPYLSYFINWRQSASEELEAASSVLQKAIKDLEPDLAIAYFKTLRPYAELTRPLFGSYRGLRQNKKPLEKHLAGAFYPVYGFGYGRSHAYRQSTTQGSIFKLVTAYAALTQKFKKLNSPHATYSDLNPLVIVDRVYTIGQTPHVGYTKEGKPIPQQYKGGRLPRSLAHKNNGEVDLIKALEVSSNPYFSLLAAECLENPEDLSEAARLFDYGCRTGIDLPGEIAGRVPTDLATNRTGLYAMAIGQHTLVTTPLQTAVMLAAIANGGKILKPKVVGIMAGRLPARQEHLQAYLPHFAYQKSLESVGVDFPLFSAATLDNQKNLVQHLPVVVKREIEMPQMVRYILLKGLRAAVKKTHQESTGNLARLYKQYPEAIRTFTELKEHIIGKTSTSESVEVMDLDVNEGTNLYTHVWFGSIAFKNDASKKDGKAFIFKDEFGQPELVVVVYLRYGGYGKEAAPLAAQMVKKWRAIKHKHGLKD